MKKRFIGMIVLICMIMTGCVDQHQKPQGQSGTQTRIIATSVAISQITDLLGLDLVGICDTKSFKLPKRYESVTRVGMPMGPDMEIMRSLKPTQVLSPTSLQSFLEEQYKEAKLPYRFLNMSSVSSMYDSIDEVAKEYGKEEEAKKLRDEYENLLKDYQEKRKDKEKPKVLVLMGLPGSYVIATNNSYVGNMVELAGGINIFKDDIEEFLPINTEELVKMQPDIILRTSHTMSEEIMDEFDEEFKTNDIWKHFDAVKNNRVYNLDNKYFGMSATMAYKEGLKILDEIFYEK
ncbi:heme ABC transporter substrate-binding protein IsdE [Peptoanaerobacter stomatis]|uniref:heme ABC transporter substrate-binding protein IsdE n=1 Tax=Peptoanaerobacter stomatis TaxID=796937 RepID=UPI003FA05112